MDTEYELLNKIAITISNLENSEKIKNLIKEAISKKIPIIKIIEEGLRKGLDIVGKKYENNEYFLSELLYAATLMNDALEILEPLLKTEKIKSKGVIVLGTVRGDIHDIGKNIFKMYAQATGFEVYDLGVDVEPEKFIEKIKETKAQILGLSALLTTTILEMKTVIEKLKEEGVRDKVKVLIGGNAVTKEFAKEIGADAAALNAIEGIEICKKWVEEK
jgi:corrinoid protein of di/trimethylamine methyltransferase